VARWRRALHAEHRVLASYFSKHHAGRADVVVCNGEYAYGVDHPRAVASFHGCYYGYARALREFSSWRSHLGMMRLARHQRLGARGKFVVADSNHLAKVLAAQGIRTDAVIENAVDDDFFAQPEGQKLDRCVVIGSYDHYGKGFDVLGRLADAGVPIDCISRDRPRHHRLQWLGPRNHHELPSIVARYKCLLFPSRFEGSGLVAAEALAAGTPVVMSNVGLGPDLREDVPAFVVDGPHATMAEAMLDRLQIIERDYDTYVGLGRAYAAKHHAYALWESKWLEVIGRLVRPEAPRPLMLHTTTDVRADTASPAAASPQ
jgi:glycosyltransferase involved in cell wall biosynthesis